MSQHTTEPGTCRVILPPRRPQCSAAPHPVRSWSVLGADEMRVRAYLWRVLGIGAAAAGRQQ
jgi:hypothetical protein